MAGKHGIAQKQDMALAAATPKTVVQIVAAANHGIDLAEVGVGFDGTDNTKEAVEIDLVRQSDAGTGGDALTIVGGNDSDGDTFDTTALSDIDSAEPTGTVVVRSWRVHPQTGFVFQPSDLAPIHVGAGDRLGLRCTSAAVVNVDAYMAFVE